MELRPYDPDWAGCFDEERARLLAALPGLIRAVEHIGSTAIPGLDAKPIIDLQAGLTALADSEQVIPKLVELGYTYMPERVFEHRIFLPRGPEERRTHYLHLLERDGEEWEVRLRFRDALRAEAALRQEYQELKHRLALQFGHDRESYTEAKSEFVARVLTALS